MRELRQQIVAYQPQDEAETQAQQEILQQWDALGAEIFQRPDAGHFTTSAVILNLTRDKMLMVYHNIYQSLGWTGGHADGAEDLLQKAIEESREETGITAVTPVSSAILSLDCLPVHAHQKKGKPIAAHVHYNVTYGFIASEKQPLRIKPDENSQVCWVSLQDWQSQCKEPHMIPIYEKLIARVKEQMADKQQSYRQ